jgi:hypothetical protein
MQAKNQTVTQADVTRSGCAEMETLPKPVAPLQGAIVAERIAEVSCNSITNADLVFMNSSTVLLLALLAQRGVEYRIQWTDESLADDWISEATVLEDYPEAVQIWQAQSSGSTRRGSIALGPRDSNPKVSYTHQYSCRSVAEAHSLLRLSGRDNMGTRSSAPS